MTTVFRLLFIVLACSAYAGDPPRETQQTAGQILSTAAKITGLDALPEPAFAPLTEGQTIPFLIKQLTGKDAFTVKFRSEPLKLWQDPPEQPDKDQFPRNFVGLFLAGSGQLVSINSRLAEKDPLMGPEPSPSDAEKQIKGWCEISGLPSKPPKVSFTDALNRVLNVGVASPFLAREISGLYVMVSMRGETRAVWIITLRGMPHFSLSNPPEPPGMSPKPRPQGTPYPEQYSEFRNIVDASTGECLGASSN